MLGNSKKSYVGDTYNDKISSMLIGHNTGSGTISDACLWSNAYFASTEEQWINGSSTTAKWIDLQYDWMQDKASSASTQWGAGSSAPSSW